jgi:hypothetical protein
LILSKKFLNQRASEGYANDYSSGNAAGLKLVSELNQIAETSAKPIKPPNHQSVPRTQRFQARVELRASLVFATGVFFVNSATLGSLQSIALQIQRLIVS